MNIGSRVLLGLIVTAAVVSGLVTYWDTMIQEDFVIVNDIEEEDGEPLDEASGEEDAAETQSAEEGEE